MCSQSSLSSALLMLLLGLAQPAPVIADETDQGVTILCRQQRRIELDTCEQLALNEIPTHPPPGARIFVLENGCLGPPDEPGPPSCVAVNLVEHATRLPVQQAVLEIRRQEGDELLTVLQKTTSASGTAQIPEWAGEVGLSSRQLEDRMIVPSAAPAAVLFRPGREVLVHCVAEPGFSQPTLAVELSLRGLDVDHSLRAEHLAGHKESLGSIPIGRYRLSLHGDGISPITEELYLLQGDNPLLIELPLVSGACVLIPVDTGAIPATASLEFVLAQTRKNQFTINDYLLGTVALEANPRLGLKQARICGLSPAWYDLSLAGPGLATEVVSFDMGKADLTLPTLYVAEASAENLSVIDDTNQPVVGAEVTFIWGEGKERRALTRKTDPQGKVKMPGFAEPTQISAFVDAEGFLSRSEVCSSIQGKIIVMHSAGRLTGTIEREVCDRSQLRYALKRSCSYRENCCDNQP